MEYIVNPSLDYMLFSENSKVSEARCFKPFSRCPITHKLMFGRKCIKIVYYRLDYPSVAYVDAGRYAYELIRYEKKGDIPLPPAFRALFAVK